MKFPFSFKLYPNRERKEHKQDLEQGFLPQQFPLQKPSGTNTQEDCTKGSLPLQCQGFWSLNNSNATAIEAPLATSIHNFPQYQVLGRDGKRNLKHSQANHSS